MDLTILNLAVPALTKDLAPSATQLLWILDIYGFFLAGFLITMGTLGDRIGRRKLLLIGAAAFGLASIVAAFSSSAEALVAARALLGIAAATLAPSTLSLIRNMFLDDRERTFAIGIWIASFSAGAMLGPVLGGLLLTYFWWGSIFLLNVPVMLLLLAVGPALLPEFRDPTQRRMDLVSVVLALAAVVAVIWGMKRLAAEGVAPLPVAIALGGLAAGLVFVQRQRRLGDDGLIDLTLFARPGFAAALAINILSLFAAYGFFLFIAQYLQLVLGMAPLEAGLWTAISGAVFVVGTMLASVLVRIYTPRSVIIAGLLLGAVGFAIMSLVVPEQGVSVLVAGMIVACLGLAPVGTLTTDLVLGMAPPERAGAASGLSETSFELGGALGIAVLGSVVTAVYQAFMITVPEATSDARETLGAALALAQGLPAEGGANLIAAAREAYTGAFRVTALICTIVVAATAVIAVKALPKLTPGKTVP